MHFPAMPTARMAADVTRFPVPPAPPVPALSQLSPAGLESGGAGEPNSDQSSSRAASDALSDGDAGTVLPPVGRAGARSRPQDLSTPRGRSIDLVEQWAS
jgi:hypothetical protein